MSDLISRQAAIDDLHGKDPSRIWDTADIEVWINELPSAEPEYEPVKAEDFAKTMSENTLYTFMAWHYEALELMERQGFVICKKKT